MPTIDLSEDAARLVAARIEQGLPEHVEDPVALARIADTLGAVGDRDVPQKEQQRETDE